MIDYLAAVHPSLAPKAQVLAAWKTAYAEWEAGTACSPSADDLCSIGWEIAPHLFPLPDTDLAEEFSDRLFNLQCEGLDLDICFDNLFATTTQETS